MNSCGNTCSGPHMQQTTSVERDIWRVLYNSSRARSTMYGAGGGQWEGGKEWEREERKEWAEEE